jgi:hypothetical protein
VWEVTGSEHETDLIQDNWSAIQDGMEREGEAGRQSGDGKEIREADTLCCLCLFNGS